MWEHQEDKYLSQILYLQGQLAIEKDEKEALRQMLARALRLDVANNKAEAVASLPKIQGVVNPSKQRYKAEFESRKKYWEKMTREVPPLPGVVSSSTQG